MFVFANQLEAGLWIAIAVVIAIDAVQRPHVRFDCIVAAVAFALFGVSDIVETTTGAWWRPRWLLMWKAACVVTFLWLLKRHINMAWASRPSIFHGRLKPRTLGRDAQARFIPHTPGCGSSTSSRRPARARNLCR